MSGTQTAHRNPVEVRRAAYALACEFRGDASVTDRDDGQATHSLSGPALAVDTGRVECSRPHPPSGGEDRQPRADKKIVAGSEGGEKSWSTCEAVAGWGTEGTERLSFLTTPPTGLSAQCPRPTESRTARSRRRGASECSLLSRAAVQYVELDPQGTRSTNRSGDSHGWASSTMQPVVRPRPSSTATELAKEAGR